MQEEINEQKHIEFDGNKQQLESNNQTKCTDVGYLIISIFVIVGLAVFSILMMNATNLRRLGLPVQSSGQTCSITKPYIVFSEDSTQISISNRSCSHFCQHLQEGNSLQNILGGVCLSNRIIYILKMRGQYQRFIQPKINSLLRIQIFKYIGIASLLFGAILTILTVKYVSNTNSNQLFIKIIGIGFPLILGGLALYFTTQKILISSSNKIMHNSQLIILVILLTFYVVYILSVVIWLACHHNNENSQQQLININNSNSNDTANKSILTQLIFMLVFTVISFVLLFVILQQYLAMISSEQLIWKTPNLYLEVNKLSYKEILVIVQGLFVINLMVSAYQYLLGGYNVVDLSKITTCSIFRRMFCQHFGSVSKSAIINSVFFLPIQIGMIIKTKQQNTKFSAFCHCLCGKFLNFCHQYSLPALAYQAATIQPINFQQCSRYLHYQFHLRKDHHENQYFLYKFGLIIQTISVSLLVLILCSTYIYPMVTIDSWSLIMAIIMGLITGAITSKTWIIIGWAQDIKQVCLNNRDIQ